MKCEICGDPVKKCSRKETNYICHTWKHNHVPKTHYKHEKSYSKISSILNNQILRNLFSFVCGFLISAYLNSNKYLIDKINETVVIIIVGIFLLIIIIILVKFQPPKKENREFTMHMKG